MDWIEKLDGSGGKLPKTSADVKKIKEKEVIRWFPSCNKLNGVQ
jgi:hypothetical protein